MKTRLTIEIEGAWGCSVYDIRQLDYDALRLECEVHGFYVTEEALRHNAEAWSRDMKSGWCDPDRGYFMFTPCGCNNLQFDIQKYTGENYQKTF